MNSRTPRLLPHRDYTVRIDGAWVFTREFLLARGTCCKSKCLNCPYGFERAPKSRANQRPVISFVPSWTETLIAADANVVGRTRFCIHPEDKVKTIASFGGTKTLAENVTEKLESIRREFPGHRPLVVLDKEENPKAFFELLSSLECDIAVTEVNNLDSLSRDAAALAMHFSPSSNLAPEDLEVAKQLGLFAARTKQLVTESKKISATSGGTADSFGPALLKTNISEDELDSLIRQTNAPILYFIWRDPWMVVSHETWIAACLGNRFPMAAFPIDAKRLWSAPEALSHSEPRSKYPQVNPADIPKGSVLLFSSEPYPFERSWTALCELGQAWQAKAVAVVDGERFSWFGLRAIRFLEER